MGPIIRQGPHHGAQQSTSTGRPLVCNASRSKVWSVMIAGFESCSPVAVDNFSPHRPHFASLVANLLCPKVLKSHSKISVRNFFSRKVAKAQRKPLETR